MLNRGGEIPHESAILTALAFWCRYWYSVYYLRIIEN